MMREALSTGNRHQQALRDLDVCRHFISGRGMMALFDVPWIPLYVLMTFALHWLLGMFTLLCAAVLVGLAIASDGVFVDCRSMRKPARRPHTAGQTLACAMRIPSRRCR